MSLHNILDFTTTSHGSTDRSPETKMQTIRLPQLVISAQRSARHHLRKLLPEFFARIDDSLFDLADKAENNQQQTLYFDAMREVRLQKDAMQEIYFESLTQGFEDALSQTKHPKEASLEQVGLVDDEQLEESLAITNMVSSAETRFKDALFALTSRLNFLIEDIDINEDNNPLSPKVFFQAFVPAANKTEGNIKVRLVIYKLFDKLVAQKMGPVYDSINADFIAAGVLPRIKNSIQKSKSAAAAEDKHTSSVSEDMNTAAGDIAETEGAPQSDNIFGVLQQLLSMSRTAPAMAGIPTAGGTTGGIPAPAISGEAYAGIPAGGVAQPGFSANAGYATGTGAENNAANGTESSNNTPILHNPVHYAPQQVLSALTQLQNTQPVLLQTQSGQATQPSAQAIKDSVLETLAIQLNDQPGMETGDAKHKQIDQDDTDAIDIVSMLFDFILDDPSLPDNLKAQIARLQIPLLKVAILDKEFFTKKTHPARQLLNELAYAGSGLPKMDQEEDAVFQMVRYVVDSIIAEFEENTEIFSSLYDEFTTFIEKERESNKMAGEILESAKDLVASEIQRRVTSNTVPPLVSIILIEAWKDVLTHIYLRDGEESTAWNTALQLADDLIWSVQPKLVVSERQRLIKVIPRVLNGLRDGLTLIQFDAEASQQLFSGLETLHLVSLRGGLSTTTIPTARKNTREAAHKTKENMPQAAAPTPATIAPTGESVQTLDEFGFDISVLPTIDDIESAEMLKDTGSSGSSATASSEDELLNEIINASTQPLPWEDTGLNASPYAEEVKNMALGTWLEFTDSDSGHNSRGKLAWRCDFTGEYTFVDRTYQVVADLSNRKLIEQLEQGLAHFVDDVPLIDRAMESVVGGIKRALSKSEKESEASMH
jgi:Protein of unknown function (DUF1631)